jgi:hypothetical protein
MKDILLRLNVATVYHVADSVSKVVFAFTASVFLDMNTTIASLVQTSCPLPTRGLQGAVTFGIDFRHEGLDPLRVLCELL